MKKPLLSSRMFFLATWVGLVLFAAALQAQTYTKTTIHYFAGGTDGAWPSKRLILDQAGNLYGVTPAGGGNKCTDNYGCGTIFKIDTSGHETVLHAFDQHHGWDPDGRLTMDPAGNLYGTTYTGGWSHSGVIFKLDTSGVFTVIHTFIGGRGGARPMGGLLYVASEKALYGTTTTGGKERKACSITRQRMGCGIVFKLASDSKGQWAFTVLYAFTGPDGWAPEGELTRDVEGNLYGITDVGGASNIGAVFKLLSGQETVLYSFMGGADGAYPVSGLLRDAAGNFFGTTSGGGGTGCDSVGCGTIYELDATGQETILHTFTESDGTNPYDRLVADTAGNLYGTTPYNYHNGDYGFGTVYKLDTSGTYSVLYSFAGGKDGEYPDGLAIDAAGNLYGTTQNGGLTSCPRKTTCGTVFKLTPQ